MIRMLLAAALAAASLFAQTGMKVSGSVTDPQGKSVAEAQVRLFRQDATRVRLQRRQEGLEPPLRGHI